MVHPEITKPNIIGSLTADVVLLFIMLIGLFRLHFGGGNASNLERVLQKQVR
jgi:hypothetical protein